MTEMNEVQKAYYHDEGFCLNKSNRRKQLLAQHHIIEIECKVDGLSFDDAFMQAEIPTCFSEEMKKRFEEISDQCKMRFSPRGVFKLFNPAICTLPPSYTEPAIKLIGTMLVLRGEDIYTRLKRASHCVLMAFNLASSFEIDSARDEICLTHLDRQIFNACCKAFSEEAFTFFITEIIQLAIEKGFYTDEPISPGEGNFPPESGPPMLFYLQAEKRIRLELDEQGIAPPYSKVCLVGMYDKSQKGRRRGCGRCKYREQCHIRALGMNCHGNKGKFS